jgi:glycosyltransferase involved in cell wall biosynthesis
MNVLAIGSDRDVLTPGSESHRRQVAYGAHFDRFDIIVFSRGKALVPVALSDTTRAIPTRSRIKMWYGLDAMRIARALPRPDIVTAQDPFETGFVAWLIARMMGAKLHVQVHTDFLSPHFARGILNKIRVLLARFVLARADHVRVVSDRIKASLHTAGYRLPAISVLPIFVDIDRFRGAHAGVLAGRFLKFSTRFLVVARLEAEKNVALALKAFAAVAPHDACLIVLGDGSEREMLKKDAVTLGVAPRVFFEGVSDPASYYAVADLILVTSRYEGYGRVIIEALAARKPVLATDVGCARKSGAIVVSEDQFTSALRAWCIDGPREAQLEGYPYRSSDEYVSAYVEDLRRCY